jgi:thiamine-phosphate pyrophosphorylase
MKLEFPKVYPILDSSIIPVAGRAGFLRSLGASLADAGLSLLEYRNKTGSDAEIIADAAILRSVLPRENVKLVLDDSVHLVDAVQFDGVHVDDRDLEPNEARRRLGPDRIVGTFGGGEHLLPGVLELPVDYLAIGPVFETRTKRTDKRPIGLQGVRRLREQAGPDVVLSAAAGITLGTAQSVLDAGASMVAVSEAIFRNSDPAGELRRWLNELH